MEENVKDQCPAWSLVPERAQKLMFGGFSAYEYDMHLFDSMQLAVESAHRFGCKDYTLHECLLVLPEAGERIVLYPLKAELSIESPALLQARMDTAVQIIERNRAVIKIVRQFWELRLPQKQTENA